MLMYRCPQLVVLLMLSTLMISCAVQTVDPSNDEAVGVASSGLAAAQWKALSQTTRNQMILDRTTQDIGVNVGVQCKQWVQNVVSGASTGVASVPPTVTSPSNQTINASGWGLQQPNQYTIGMSTDIRNVQPGWIVQMDINLAGGGVGPHTAIVVGRSQTGINWVESNWSGDTTVRLRFQTFTAFEQSTYRNGQYQYSVYYVGGG